MSAKDELEARIQYWSGGDYPELAARLGGNLHPRMMLALGQVRPGAPWLDVACGAGTIALMAARQGAKVTAQDLSPRMIELARAEAAGAELNVTFDVGDCQRMTYPDGSFEVVTSAHGAVFAPDHEAVAGEITRLCRPGGKAAISAWTPQEGFLELANLEAEFTGRGPADQNSPFEWGDPEYVDSLLGGAFQLQFFTGDSPIRGESPEALTRLFWEKSPRTVAVRARLGPDREHELWSALLAFFGRHAGTSGVVVGRSYLIAVGKRKV
ncbi:MAG: Methyltransferase type 11 [Patescibacteria group bacterium]|nr:Methyltransferase type 11 [Patescibacteria group bacterium]